MLLWFVVYVVFNDLIVLNNTMVGLGGLEPPTSRLSGVRSNHLSYKPILIVIMVEMRRFELLTSCLQGRRSPD